MIISEQEKKRIIRLHEATSTDSSGSYETPLFREPQAEDMFDFMSQPDVVGGDNLVNDEDIVVIDMTDETDTEDFLSDIFDMTDEDDEERMRVLHKEHSIIKEQGPNDEAVNDFIFSKIKSGVEAAESLNLKTIGKIFGDEFIDELERNLGDKALVPSPIDEQPTIVSILQRVVREGTFGSLSDFEIQALIGSLSVNEQVNQMGTGSGFLGTQGGSDRLDKFTKRQDIGEGEDVDSELYEGMDATNIDLEKTAESEEESDWMQEDWDDLSEDVQNAYKEHKEFKGMEESAIREKFNAMPLEALCKISRFMFGWIVKLFRAPVSAFTKNLRKTSPMAGRNYGRRRAWPCKKRYKRW